MRSGPNLPQPPSRDEVAAQLRGLVRGERTAQQVDEWASQWVLAPDAGVEDPVVWVGLNLLVGASVRVGESEFLYGEEDYRSWLSRFEKAANADDQQKNLWRVWMEAEARIRHAIGFLADREVAAGAEGYLKNNEFGLALESLVERVDESELDPPDDFWLACSDAAEAMGLLQMCGELRRRVRGW